MTPAEIAKVYATLDLATETAREQFTTMKRANERTNITPIFPAGGSSLPSRIG